MIGYDVINVEACLTGLLKLMLAGLFSGGNAAIENCLGPWLPVHKDVVHIGGVFTNGSQPL